MPYYSKKRSYSKAYPKARHVDKKLLLSSGNLTASTQSNVTLYTASVACTLKGLRINGSISDAFDVNTPANVSWALLVIREGRFPNNINTGSSGDFYVPESEVWSWGVGKAVTTSDPNWIYEFDIAPKTSRKLEQGDKLVLSIVSSQDAQAITNTLVSVVP